MVPDWRRYLVFFIPKTNSDKFRPISLASSICKIVERMVCNRLMWWLEFNSKLPNSQFGFRRNKSCLDILTLLYANIIESFKKDTATMAVFLDIKSAYDNVLSDILIDKLKLLGVPPKMLSFIYSIVSERQIFCRFGDVDEVCWAFRGLPQGSVLSPVFYDIYTADLDSLGSSECKIVQYADDVTFFTDLSPINVGIRCLEEVLNRTSGILCDLGLSLAPEKTKFCIFKKSGRKPLDSYPSLALGNFQIPNHESVRFLGMTLSSSLSWEAHINQLWQACQSPLKILSCLQYTWWGSDPRLLLRLYYTLIQSRLEYGGFLLHNLNKKMYLKLNRIQYKALWLALGFRLSTPINVILAETREPPLNLRFQYLDKIFLTRIAYYENHLLNLILENISVLNDTPTFVSKIKDPPLLDCYRIVKTISHLLQGGQTVRIYEILHFAIFRSEGRCVTRSGAC